MPEPDAAADGVQRWIQLMIDEPRNPIAGPSADFVAGLRPLPQPICCR